jgi:hypothetical protein
MTVSVSERLREALERLDQAIDRLDASVSAGSGAAAPAGEAGKSADTVAIAARLDRIIERVETALAD